MKKLRILFLALLAFSLLFQGCHKDDDDVITPKKPEEVVPDQGNETDEEAGTLTAYRIESGNLVKEKDYEVSGELLTLQQDVTKHQEMWNLVKKLIPSDYLNTYFNQFLIIHSEEIAGYVAETMQDLSKWQLGLAINMAYSNGVLNGDKEFSYTIIHEFGHVLTLNSTQVEAPGDASNTATFFTGEGSSKEKSYINQFFQKFWTDIYKEHQNLSEEERYQIYEKYPDRFVTDYAATNPGEDIAETFAVFVTRDQKPEGATMAEKKILFLYEFPELVELRQQIRGASTKQLPAPGKWKSKSIYKVKMKKADIAF